ncbi:PqqD family protein [Eubacterium sp. AF15-50]|uniref:PqqD family protein n=1 Tax=unclassified Eubacterium (in: firmicutes) TaxID=2624479 RepID=UPI000E4676B3|nr:MULTISPECIES: PqqD family protein [unclassified Eubacterium (in: firmicutes)]RHR71953.1 PqqD family protein [Eubacterium sp. AF16-48]RHR79443.1 PqqD family protein [Eubacterium sp. AF15-50]
MKIREGFLLRNVAGNNVVVPIGQATLDFNGMMSLNETGAFIFSKMLDGTTKEQLIEDLISEYEVEWEIAQKDVDDFIKKVEGEGLLE